MIVWLASFPRSGNTYLRILIYYLCGEHTYSIYSEPAFKEAGICDYVGHKELPKSLKELEKEDKVYFIKTHGMLTDDNPAIYLIRDGRESLNSWAHFRVGRKDKPMGLKAYIKYLFNRKIDYRTTLRDVIVEKKHYGGWSGNAFGWTSDRLKGQTVVVRYEELLRNPRKKLKEVFSALGLKINVSDNKVPEFEEFKKKSPSFFREGRVDSWKEDMPEDLLNLFWVNHRRCMMYFGYC